MGAVGTIATNIDKVFVWHFLGAIPTALYSIATLLPTESVRIGRMLAQALLPKFSLVKKESLQAGSIIKKLFYFMGLLLIIWSIYALSAPTLFHWLLPDYTEIVPHTIVAMTIIFTTPTYIIRSLFMSQK